MKKVENELLKQPRKKKISPKVTNSKEKKEKEKKKDELKVDAPPKSIAIEYLTNTKDSATLMDFSQKEMQKKIDKVYPRRHIHIEHGRTGKAGIDPKERERLDKIEGERLKQHRQHINQRLKALEKELPFVSELELKEVGCV